MGRPRTGYFIDGEPVIGTTTVCGLLNKPALVAWAGKLATDVAWRAGKAGDPMPRWNDILYGTRDSAAESGTLVHEMFEARLRGQPLPILPDTAVGKAAQKGYENAVHWLDSSGLVIKPHERPLVSKSYRFGGTPDATMESQDGGMLYLGDWKCLLPAQTVQCATGELLSAEMVRAGNVLLGYDTKTGRFAPDRVRAVASGGVQPCVEVVTRWGRRLRCSANHPVRVGEKWKRAGNLRENDALTVCVESNSANETISLDEARLLGIFVGDFHNREITKQAPEMVDDIRRLAEFMGWDMHRMRRPHDYRIDASIDWLKRHGLWNARAGTKHIPDVIMRGTPDVIWAFLCGYFDCDGTVSSPDSGKLAVAFDTTSTLLAQQVFELLARSGIGATLWRDGRHAYYNDTNVKRRGISAWRVCTQSQSASRRLLACLDSLRHCQKRARRDAWLEILYAARDTNRTRPINEDIVRSVSPLLAQPTIAIEMEKYGTFVTSGLVTHNTGGIYHDMLIQMSAYRQLIKECEGQTVTGVHLVRFSKEHADFTHHFFGDDALDLGWEVFVRLLEMVPTLELLKKRVK